MPPAALISSIASCAPMPALLAGIGQRARNRMQHADLHRRALRAQHGRRVQQAGGRGGAERRGLQEPAAADGRKSDETCVSSLVAGREPNIGPPRLLYCPRVRRTAYCSGMNEPQTLIDKLWAAHEIVRREDGESLLWVDRHYVHEGSFHAFGKLAERGVAVAEPGLTFGVADHYVPTRGSRTRHRQSRDRAHGAAGRGEHGQARHQAVRAGRSAPGHRACGRPGAGADAAGPADRLRRQPHLDAMARSAPMRSASAPPRWRMC